MEDSKLPGGCYFPRLYSIVLGLNKAKNKEQASLISAQLRDEARRLDKDFNLVPKGLDILRSLYESNIVPVSFLPKGYFESMLRQDARGLVENIEGFVQMSEQHTAKYGLNFAMMEQQHFYLLGVAKSEYQGITTSLTDQSRIYTEMATLFFKGVEKPYNIDSGQLIRCISDLDDLIEG